MTGDAHQPRLALDHEVVTGLVSSRPVLAETRDAGIDQARIARAQRGRVEAVAGKRADLEILDHDIGAIGEQANRFGSLGLGDVDRGASLAAVGREEIGRDAVFALAMPGRAPIASVVTLPRALDLDDVRTEVGKLLGAPGAGKDPAKVENANALERLQARRLQGRRSASTAAAALCPGAPVTPPPGWAPEPHRYSPGSGMR